VREMSSSASVVASGVSPDIEGGIVPPGPGPAKTIEIASGNQGSREACDQSTGRDARLYGRPEARRHGAVSKCAGRLIERCRSARNPFPLTPTLSLGERERRNVLAH